MEGVLSKILYKLESLPEGKSIQESKGTQTTNVVDQVSKKLKTMVTLGELEQKRILGTTSKYKPPKVVSDRILTHLI